MDKMFGLMEIVESSLSPDVIQAIIPTVVVPFLLVGAILGSIVSAIAGWFGVTLKTKGPMRLLELLLTPRILASALVLNGMVFSGIYAYRWLDNHSRPLLWINLRNAGISPVSSHYPDTDSQQATKEHSAPKFAARKPGATPPTFTEIWTTKLPKTSFRQMTAAGSSLFVSSLDGSVYEISTESGAITRRFYVGKPIAPSPVIRNEHLYVGEGDHPTHHGRLYVFHLPSGKLVKSHTTKGHTQGDLVMAKIAERDLVFAPAGHDGLHVLDADSLEPVWHAPLSHFDGGVTIETIETEGQWVYGATGVEKDGPSPDPALVALEAATGKEAWRVHLAASVWSRPVVWSDAVCVGMGEIYREHRYGQLACFERKTGLPVAAMNWSAPIFNTPLLIAGSLVVADLKGQVCRLSRPSSDEGIIQRTWCTKLPVKGRMYAAPSYDEARGLLGFLSDEGFHLLNFEDGSLAGEWKPHTEDAKWLTHYAQPTFEDEAYYLIDKSGALRKIKVQF
jgi:outer membrane protein assembly factor BamB